jgi:hypothetical protein
MNQSQNFTDKGCIYKAIQDYKPFQGTQISARPCLYCGVYQTNYQNSNLYLFFVTFAAMKFQQHQKICANVISFFLRTKL